MANSYDVVSEWWDVRRLRTPETPYYTGAVAPGGEVPAPIAEAYGGQFVGPHTNAVGASEYWLTTLYMPRRTDVVWVVVQQEIVVYRTDADAGENESVVWAVYGNSTYGTAWKPPAYGFGSTIDTTYTGQVNVYDYVDTHTQPQASHGRYFDILEPETTGNTWYGLLGIRVNSGGAAQDSMMWDMTRCRLLGFPVNAWRTGALHALQGDYQVRG